MTNKRTNERTKMLKNNEWRYVHVEIIILRWLSDQDQAILITGNSRTELSELIEDSYVKPDPQTQSLRPKTKTIIS